ncbi:MAG: LPXTG cell wall anchor domain-containing protein, partial [Candidatus Hodarchaeota archaeon]
ISWTATDLHPDTYIIYQDGSNVDQDSWVSGTPITYSLDGLIAGQHSFQISVKDNFENMANDTVNVQVNPISSSVTSATSTGTTATSGLLWVEILIMTFFLSILFKKRHKNQ